MLLHGNEAAPDASAFNCLVVMFFHEDWFALVTLPADHDHMNDAGQIASGKTM